MAELLIDTIDRVEEAFNLLVDQGIAVSDYDGSENVRTVPDDDEERIEKILEAAGIEYQWWDPDWDENVVGRDDVV